MKVQDWGNISLPSATAEASKEALFDNPLNLQKRYTLMKCGARLGRAILVSVLGDLDGRARPHVSGHAVGLVWVARPAGLPGRVLDRGGRGGLFFLPSTVHVRRGRRCNGQWGRLLYSAVLRFEQVAESAEEAGPFSLKAWGPGLARDGVVFGRAGVLNSFPAFSSASFRPPNGL